VHADEKLTAFLELELAIRQLAQFTIKTNLKQSEEFENNHDDDNYSYYVEDVSVHARQSYQPEYAIAITDTGMIFEQCPRTGEIEGRGALLENPASESGEDRAACGAA
jgi:hypothetical protein